MRTEIFRQRVFRHFHFIPAKRKEKEERRITPTSLLQSLDDIICPKHRLVLGGNLCKITLETEFLLDDRETGRGLSGKAHTHSLRLQTCTNGEQTVDVYALVREDDRARFGLFDCHFFFPPHIQDNLPASGGKEKRGRDEKSFVGISRPRDLFRHKLFQHFIPAKEPEGQGHLPHSLPLSHLQIILTLREHPASDAESIGRHGKSLQLLFGKTGGNL